MLIPVMKVKYRVETAVRHKHLTQISVWPHSFISSSPDSFTVSLNQKGHNRAADEQI